MRLFFKLASAVISVAMVFCIVVLITAAVRNTSFVGVITQWFGG